MTHRRRRSLFLTCMWIGFVGAITATQVWGLTENRFVTVAILLASTGLIVAGAIAWLPAAIRDLRKGHHQ